VGLGLWNTAVCFQLCWHCSHGKRLLRPAITCETCAGFLPSMTAAQRECPGHAGGCRAAARAAAGWRACCFPSTAAGERRLRRQRGPGAVQQLRALWSRLHSQAMSLGRETMVFGLLQDAGDSARQAGQEMCCLVSPAFRVALWHPGGVGLPEPPQPNTPGSGNGAGTLSGRWKTQLRWRSGP